VDRWEDYWDTICQIHLLTKHYLLLAEEINDKGELFLQPLKEHRDAYDHIIRIYGMKFNSTNNTNDKFSISKYKEKNMEKALGHEYRAFFDTADWLSLICKAKIFSLLEGKSPIEIVKQYPNYMQAKEIIMTTINEVAAHREEKDISKGMLKTAMSYKKTLDALLKVYKEIYLAFS
jgi:hypothetical protein